MSSLVSGNAASTVVNPDQDFIVVVPARLASTRLPNKPLSLVNEIPLVVRVLDTCSLIGAKAIILATDHQDIKTTVDHYIQNPQGLLSDLSSVQVVMTSTKHNNGTERICEVIEKLGIADNELVVNIQGDEPFFNPQVIQNLVQTFITKEAQDPRISMGTIGEPCPTEDVTNPNVVKVVTDNDGNAIYFSRSPIPYARTVKVEEFAYTKHAGVYCYRAHFVKKYKQLPVTPLATVESLEQLKLIESGYKINLVKIPVHGFIGVDTAQDLEKANLVAKDYDHQVKKQLAEKYSNQDLSQAKLNYLTQIGQ